MRAARRRWAERVVLLVVAALAVTGQLAGSAQLAVAAGRHCTAPSPQASRIGRFGGIERPTYRSVCARAAARIATPGELPYEAGTKPPLHLQDPAAKVMATSPTTPLTVTPVFWAGRSGAYGFSSAYTSLIQQYIADVAADSGSPTNTFASLTQYYLNSAGRKVHVRYNIAGRAVTIGRPFIARDSLPRSCAVSRGRIYHNDPVGYTTCVADSAIASEVQRLVARRHWRADLNSVYVIFLPKHVEACFYRNDPAYQQCSVNNGDSSAFCAYHSYTSGGPQAVYATLPYPVYSSTTNGTCSSEIDAPGAQYPNHRPDADVVLSSVSHEVSEAITDPKLTAWRANDGNENGDLCSDIYGALDGPAGARWNQTINGHHYLVQEEFSDKEYAPGRGGCVQDENLPTVSSVAPAHGASGRTVTVHGTGFRPGRTTVLFGGTPASIVTGTTTTTLNVRAPADVGVADVRVSTPNGTSPTSSADLYLDAPPTITDVASPGTGGDTVTITGTNFAPYADQMQVSFGGHPAAVQSATTTSMTVTVPAGPASGTSVDVTVASAQGSYTASDAFRYP